MHGPAPLLVVTHGLLSPFLFKFLLHYVAINHAQGFLWRVTPNPAVDLDDIGHNLTYLQIGASGGSRTRGLQAVPTTSLGRVGSRFGCVQIHVSHIMFGPLELASTIPEAPIPMGIFGNASHPSVNSSTAAVVPLSKEYAPYRGYLACIANVRTVSSCFSYWVRQTGMSQVSYCSNSLCLPISWTRTSTSYQRSSTQTFPQM